MRRQLRPSRATRHLVPHIRVREVIAHLHGSGISCTQLAERAQHVQRVTPLPVHASARQPAPQRRDLARVHARRLLEQPGKAALRIERPPGQRHQHARRLGGDHGLRRRRRQCGPDIDQRVRQRPVAILGRPVHHGHLVIGRQRTAAEAFEDLTHPHHPESLELARAQRAHAGAAEHVDALGHGPQDLLVPHRGHALEVAVDDADRPRTRQAGAVHVALRGWREEARPGQDRLALGRRQRGPGEDADAHDRACPCAAA